MTASPVDPPTDPLPRAVAEHRVRTAVLPRLRALCGQETHRGPCHLAAHHAGGHLPPPPRIVRPYEWARR